MPTDIMSSEPRHRIVFGQLVMLVQCCAEARWRLCLSTAVWPNTIQCLDCLGSDGIKSFATEGVGPKNLSRNHQCPAAAETVGQNLSSRTDPSSHAPRDQIRRKEPRALAAT